MKTTLEDKKRVLLSELTAARRSVLEAVQTLAPAQLDEVFLGVWSVKDLLAHLVGWDITIRFLLTAETRDEIEHARQISTLRS